MAEWDSEVDVDERLAHALIGEHFPSLDSSSLELVGEGWDNVVWATAEGIAFRFPRREVAIPGVKREIAILPALAVHLPLQIPDAKFAGVPSTRFPWPWFGSRLIPGHEIATAELNDAQRSALAPAFGAFLRALHSFSPSHLSALPLDPMKRTDMPVRVPKTRDALDEAAALWSPPEWVGDLLELAMRLQGPHGTVLAHGDLHVRHLLLDDTSKLVGIIDWGDMCRAHRSADLSLYWSLFPPAGRTAFLEAYGLVEEHTLIRARVLALFLCARLAVYAHAEGLSDLEREAIGGLQRTVVGGNEALSTI
jgi:aminoglycoside phosphotransferase (APT) family kinase protein